MIVIRRYIGLKIVTCVTLAAFTLTGLGLPTVNVYAQEAYALPKPGVRLELSPSFLPPLLKGIKIYPDNPFRLDFIVDKGDRHGSAAAIQEDSARLLRYFLAALTVPEKDLWVNLSPYEKDRIVPDALGQTEMGRDLLAQDYILKQITASAIYPEGKLGKEFWSQVYASALKRYGTTNVPVNTFNKVWIVPAKAEVYEHGAAAYVLESRLKVMLEEDYAALGTPGADGKGGRQNVGLDIVREVVLPILEKEVNEGARFVRLRQVYQALILATWFKDQVRESLLGQAYVDRNKIAGVEIADKKEKEKIWARYCLAFKKGVYNYIKEERDLATSEIVPRQYFSGGAALFQIRKAYHLNHGDEAQIPPEVPTNAEVLEVRLDKAMAKPALTKAQNKGIGGFTAEELQAFQNVIQFLEVNLTSKETRKDRLLVKDKMAEDIAALTRGGIRLFSERDVSRLFLVRGLSQRLAGFLRLARYQYADGVPVENGWKIFRVTIDSDLNNLEAAIADFEQEILNKITKKNAADAVLAGLQRERAGLFTPYQIMKLRTRQELQKRLELVAPLMGMQNADGTYVFSGTTLFGAIMQTPLDRMDDFVSTAWQRYKDVKDRDAEQADEIADLLERLKIDGVPVLNKGQLDDVRQRVGFLKKLRIAVQMSEMQDAKGKSLFTRNAIYTSVFKPSLARFEELARAVVAQKQDDRKKNMTALSALRRQGAPLFKPDQQDILTKKSESLARFSLAEQLSNVVYSDGKYVLSPANIFRIVFHCGGTRLDSIAEQVDWLAQQKGKDTLQRMYTGSAIVKIVLNTEEWVEKQAFIEWLQEQGFDGSHIARSLVSAGDCKLKRAFIESLFGYTQPDGRAPLFNFSNIGLILASGETQENIIKLIDWLLERGFTGEQIARVVNDGWSRKDTEALVSGLLEIKAADGKSQLLRSSEVVRCLKYKNQFSLERFAATWDAVKHPGVSYWPILKFFIYPKQAKAMFYAWQSRPMDKWTEDELRQRFDLLTRFASKSEHSPSLGLEDILIIAAQFLSAEEMADFKAYVFRSFEEDKDILSRLQANKKVDNELMRRLLVSFNFEVREEARKLLRYEWLKEDEARFRRVKPDYIEALEDFVRHYNWSRPDSSVEKMRRNIMKVQNIAEQYLHYRNLGSETNSVLRYKYQLRKDGKMPGEISEILNLRFGVWEVQAAISESGRTLSLDQNPDGSSIYAYLSDEGFMDDEVDDLDLKIVEVSINGYGSAVVQASNLREALLEYIRLVNGSASGMAALMKEGVQAQLNGQPIVIGDHLRQSLSKAENIFNIKLNRPGNSSNSMDGGDAAMTALGGVDLTSNILHVRQEVPGGGARFTFDQSMLQGLENAPGLIPVIVNMQPMSSSVRVFLGLEN